MVIRVLMVAAIAAGCLACAPSDAQVKRVLENNPEIIYAAMKKDPERFVEAATEATKIARAAQKSRALDEQMKTRKEPELSPAYAFAGEPSAPITIVEYSDFQCPFCARAHGTVRQVLDAYAGKIRLYVKHNPIEQIHPFAMSAARMYEALALQDAAKAMQFRDLMFAGQQELNKRGDSFIRESAERVGANMAQALRDAQSEAVTARIEKDRAEAAKFGFSGTPVYLINGVPVMGARPIDEFRQIIDKLMGVKPAPWPEKAES